MRILIVHRYWWPDSAPAGTIFRAIGERWAADGHSVNVFSAQPDYNSEAATRQPATEAVGGVTIRRTSLLAETKTTYIRRALNYALFLGRAAAQVLGAGIKRRPYDLVVALTAPPVAPAIVLGAAARRTGGALLYQCMDVFPELALESGLASPGFRTKLLSRLDARSTRLATRTVVLSTDMADLVQARADGKAHVEIINNLDLEQFSDVEPAPPELEKQGDELQFLFAGNLGRFQSLDTVIDAAHALSLDDPTQTARFDFLGTGISRDRLIERAGALVGDVVRFHDPVGPSAAAAAVRAADVALVTLAPGVIRAAYPSKTMTILRSGSPLLAMVEPDSELGRMITDEGLGAVVAPGDVHGFADTVRWFGTADLGAIGARCRAVYEERFEREVLLDKWSALADEIELERKRS